jgi:uncharacterized repeat protein (TIGR02543 family)
MNKKIIIALSTVCVVLLGAVIALLVLKDKPKDPEPTPEPEPSVEKVTIKFDANGGEAVEDLLIDKGAQVLLPSTTKEGYLFDGWYLNNEKIKSTHVYNEDITVVAKWEKKTEEVKTFKVTFDSKGGSKVNAQTIECGKALTLPSNPTKSGYTFKGWEDKHGKSILTGAKFTCENVTLYAIWEKNEEKPVVEPTPEPQKTYTCPTGYTLNGTKCTIETTAKEKCPDGTSVDGSLCIKTSDYNSGTRVCKEYTVSIDGKGHTWTGKGDYYFIPNAYGSCAYYKWESYTTQTQCEQANDINHKTKWVSYLNGCYAETKASNYETVCSSDYQYYTSGELSSKFGIHNDGRCLRKVAKTKYCDVEGYTLTNNKCVKTIDATLN